MLKIWYVSVRVVMSSLKIHGHLGVHIFQKKGMHSEARESKWIEID